MGYFSSIINRRSRADAGPAGKPGDPGRRGWERGFTMLELVCVLALLALITGLVMPGLQRAWKRERDRASLRQLAIALRTARSEAATRRQRVRLFLDLQTGQYRLEGSPQVGELSGMRLSEASLVWQDPFKRNGYIAFYGDGCSSGGKLTLIDTAGQRHLLEVEIITGKVSLKAGQG